MLDLAQEARRRIGGRPAQRLGQDAAPRLGDIGPALGDRSRPPLGDALEGGFGDALQDVGSAHATCRLQKSTRASSRSRARPESIDSRAKASALTQSLASPATRMASAAFKITRSRAAPFSPLSKERTRAAFSGGSPPSMPSR